MEGGARSSGKLLPLGTALVVVALQSGCSRDGASKPGAGSTTLPPMADAGAPPVAAAAAPPGEPAKSASLVIASRDGKRLASYESPWLRFHAEDTLATLGIAPVCLVHQGAWATRPCTVVEYPTVHAIGFSRTGDAVAIACQGCAPGGTNTVHALRVPSGELVFATQVPVEPWHLAWGDADVVLADSSWVLTLDPATGAQRSAFRSDESPTSISPDGSAFVTGYSRKMFGIDGKPRHRLSVSAAVPVVALDRGAAVAFDNGAKLFDAAGREGKSAWHYARGSVGPIAASRDGAWAAAAMGGPDGSYLVRRFGVTAETMLELPVGKAPRDLAVGSKGEVWAAFDPGGVRRLSWPLVSRGVAVSPDGLTVASLHDRPDPPRRRALRILDGRTLAQKLEIDAAFAARLAFSPDGRSLAVSFASAAGRAVAILEVGSAREVARVDVPFEIQAIAWSRAGLVAMGRLEAAVIDPATRKLLRTVKAAPEARLDGLAPDASAVLERVPGKRWERQPRPGHREWGSEPDVLTLISTVDGSRTLADPSSRGELLLLGAGAMLRADGPGSGPPSRVVHLVKPGSPDVELTIAGTLIAASPDGRCFATSDGSYRLRVYRPPTATPVVSVDASTATNAIAIDRDCTLFVASPHRALERFAAKPLRVGRVRARTRRTEPWDPRGDRRRRHRADRGRPQTSTASGSACE